MQKYWVWTITSGMNGGKIVEAENSVEARKVDGDALSTMARALETSEGELGYWTQHDNGPVWNAVGEAPPDRPIPSCAFNDDGEQVHDYDFGDDD